MTTFKFQLVLNADESLYLLDAVERRVIDAAATVGAHHGLPRLFAKRELEAKQEARRELRIGAGLMAKLSPQNLEAIDDNPQDEQASPQFPLFSDDDIHALSRAVPDFDPRALKPRCVHGLLFDEPCERCREATTRAEPNPI